LFKPRFFTSPALRAGRPVAYVHCVMHKCIMVKLGGNEKHIKFVKNTQILRNQGEI